MVKTYERHVDLDSITVIEASTNSAILKRRLEEAGFRAEVVRSDTIADKERRRKVCDIQDARNLALAYIKGDVKDFVWTPSDEYSEYRDVMFAYRDTVKELVRTSNRMWSICSRKGYALPVRSASAKVETLRGTIEGAGIGGFAKEQLEMLLEDYERLLKRKDALSRRMAETVLSKPGMLRLMQLQGVNYKGAFAISAAVEDVRRFPTAAKLSAYCGFAPVLDTSGGEEEKARRRGGTGKPLDGEGRDDVKHFFTEAGQAVLTSCAGSKLGKWGWAMVNRGKHRNKVVCAIGHKLVLYAFHIMRGDPTPNRDNEELFKRKMRGLHQKIGAGRMHELGHGTREQFADAQAKLVYGSLPESAASCGAASQETESN
jgi:transposase